MARVKRSRVEVVPQPPSLSFRPKHPQQLEALDVLHQNAITFLCGPAGTAKTFLASWYAISSALQQQFKKIYVSRPAVTSGADIGYLPGSAEMKMQSFLAPLYDAREKIGTTAIDQIRSCYEVLPLCYIKGRTIENAILIVDEGQNLTSEEMFNIVTRIGEGGKIVICGDQMQGDLRDTVLDQAAETYEGACIAGYSVGMYRFTKDAIVRHPLVSELIDRTMRAAWYGKVRRGVQ